MILQNKSNKDTYINRYAKDFKIRIYKFWENEGQENRSSFLPEREGKALVSRIIQLKLNWI